MDPISHKSRSHQTAHIVDDNANMRESLSAYLIASNIPTKAYPSASDFLESYNYQTTGCLILDYKMPEMSGLELQEKLVTLDQPLLPIIIVSGHARVTEAVKAMKLGCFDFIQKPYDPDTLLRRIKNAFDTDRKLREEHQQLNKIKSLFEKLSPREKEILPMIVCGKQSKEIATIFNVSVSTVDNHRSNIMKKLNIKTVVEMTKIAILLDPKASKITTH
jgi:RNA polymerase sigma factor (sigma-70 family)